jgi:rhodanese-related sulfurtransferase
MTDPRPIAPDQAIALIAAGARLVDIREADEHRRERIAGAAHCPLSRLAEVPIEGGHAIIFHCASGMRTQTNAARLAEKAGGRESYLLDGGLAGWRKAGLPTARSRGAPIELQRQVMIVAGTLVLVGALLAAFVAPAFVLVPIFVGAGLLFAGVSGFCGMARLLMLAPWNRPEPSGA